MTDTAATRQSVQNTTFAVLFAIGFCHMLNDMMQALLPAIYPSLKQDFHLNFTQIGLITLAYQITASLLQPMVGYFSDRKPMPYSLAAGAVFTLIGLLGLSIAGSYGAILICAMVIGIGSAVFHPESSRVARMASGGRHGLAQSVFQLGGNTGSALGPLLAAGLVASYGQRSIAWAGLLALTSIIVLYNVGTWYKHHGLARMHHHSQAHHNLSSMKVWVSMTVLLMLMFSKFFYLASITSYYTFYLIQTFHVSLVNAQVHLFLFLGAVAAGTMAGGPLGDRFGRKYVIWLSILGILPFTMALPYANLFWTSILSVIIGVVLASAFPAIVVYAQELLPGRVGMISGMFFGFSFGMGGIGAAVLGWLADQTSITFVYKVCAFLPAIGLLTAFLPNIGGAKTADTGGGSRAVTIQDVARKYAVAVSPAIRALIDSSDPADPIARQFLPDVAELTVTPEELADPIADEAHAPVKGIVHRHPDRVLLKAVNACPVYCRFCFRREMVGPGKGGLTPSELADALAYIRSRPEIWEVILTGGDPFILSPRRMRQITDALAQTGHVKIVRWHSRVPVVEPERVTDELASALIAPGITSWVAIHANHPRELGPRCARRHHPPRQSGRHTW